MCGESTKQLMFDDFTGRYFNSSLLEIERILGELNTHLMMEGDVCLADFYDMLGLESAGVARDFGWTSGEGRIEVRYSGMITQDQRSAISVRFFTLPKNLRDQ